MQTVYLDNAATTPIAPEVIEIMASVMRDQFGNPSSAHTFGRKARSIVEMSRKTIAAYLNCSPAEIIFTSGGTEANNMILRGAVVQHKIKRIITSKLEHQSVLKTLEDLSKHWGIPVEYVRFDKSGTIDPDDLEKMLSGNGQKTLVSLMAVNNELGNLLDIENIARICKQNGALFHSDSVQAIAHQRIDLQKIPIDFLTASAHKFHGPKGVGFAYISKKNALTPMITGGEQEKGLRAGTENVQSIAGMEKALKLVEKDFDMTKAHLSALKSRMIDRLRAEIPGVMFNGKSSVLEKSAPQILNVRFPKTIPMLLFKLDMKGLAVSGGSACQSGSQKASHVLTALLDKEQLKLPSIRISFSKFNTVDEIDRAVEILSGEIL